MINTVKTYCENRISEFGDIPETRKKQLSSIADYIRNKKAHQLPVRLVYICTHNSRRSHFGQIWSHVAADYFGVSDVYTFSGGTEATAFHPNAIAAVERAGCAVKKTTETPNPVYEVVHDPQSAPSICFSKVYDHPSNPAHDFAAIMTCGDAEENCPFIPGVELRIATTYEDPKAFDGTPLCEEKYDERCRQIAREALYVFALLSKNA